LASELALQRAREDFRVFLFLIWRHLGLPDPTPAQYEIAWYLQHGPHPKLILAFRGVGKSWITAAFVLWLLFNDPELKVLVVSASKDRSDAFSVFTKRLLSEVRFLKHLAPDPRKGDRDSNVQFDVRGCKPAQAPSVKSVGITGQVTGSRADFIVCDDVEVPNNSETATQREKLINRCAELGGAVLTPEAAKGERGGVAYLGTFQVEDSLYLGLADKEYELRIWPALIPEEPAKYRGMLAPSVQARVEAGERPGSAIDPIRFDEFELAKRQVEYGKAGFSLQFMLDTSLSDEDRHPLRCRDMLVLDVDQKVAPDFVVWAGDSDHVLEHLPRCGLVGDRFHKPMKVSPDFTPYEAAVLYIDPSGRGKDQTGYAVVKRLNSMLFLRRWGALPGGYDNRTLSKLALIAKQEQVNTVVIEDNFGDGMYAQLFRPVLQKVYRRREEGYLLEGCTVEDDHVTGQKEVRIIETLEPVLAMHRLVVDTAVIAESLASKETSVDPDAALKTGFYQLTRLTKDRGCLKYDDHVDALAGAVRWHQERLGTDTRKAAKERKAERIDEGLRKFAEDYFGTTGAKSWTDRM
jgi:hypothetical protein